jgi:hypothetical protein
VEVTAESTALISESAATIGQVLSQKRVQDLPLVSNNVLDLMQTMAEPAARLGDITFAGVSTSMGTPPAMASAFRTPLRQRRRRYHQASDMVGEFRVISRPLMPSSAAATDKCKS